MDNVNKLDISSVVKQERQKLGISLDEASRRTGVSKAMLGQIERNISSPTLSTVWKISAGLRIPMATLLAQNRSSDYKVTKLKDIEPLPESHGSIRVYNLFPFDPLSGLDYLYIEIDPNFYYESTGHANALEEYVVCTKGTLTMHVAGKIYELEAGDSMSFKGSEEHGYENRTDEPAIFQTLMRY